MGPTGCDRQKIPMPNTLWDSSGDMTDTNNVISLQNAVVTVRKEDMADLNLTKPACTIMITHNI